MIKKSLEKKSKLADMRRESLAGEKGYWRSDEHGLGAAGSILEPDVMHTL